MREFLILKIEVNNGQVLVKSEMDLGPLLLIPSGFCNRSECHKDIIMKNMVLYFHHQQSIMDEELYIQRMWMINHGIHDMHLIPVILFQSNMWHRTLACLTLKGLCTWKADKNVIIWLMPLFLMRQRSLKL